MRILDLFAGKRAIWFDKTHPLAVFVDRRAEVNPTIVADLREMPDVGSGYDLVVLDPPHMNCGPNSNMSRVYGYSTTAEILETVKAAGELAFRATRPNALMALKWNDHDIRLQRVFGLLPRWEPLFGQVTQTRPVSKTYWVMLRRSS